MPQTERQIYVEWCWFLVVVFVQYIPSIYILYVQWPAYLYLLKQKAEIFVFFSDKIIYQRFKDFFEVALSFLFPRLKINLVSYIVIKHYFLLSFMKIGCRTDAFMCITLKQAHKSINVEQYHGHIFCSVSFEKIISKWSRKTEIFDWQSAVEVAGLFVMTSPRHHQGAHRPSLALQGVEQSRSVSDWLSEWMYHSVLIHPYYFNKVFHRFKSTLFFLVTEKMIEVTAVENFQQFLSNANVRRVMCDTFLISYWLYISLIMIRSR